jgi:hypothetical protein
MGEIARVSKIPRCDIRGCSNDAGYDGKTNLGPWAYMCEKHFKELGIGLGTGKGQKLVVIKDEIR